MQRGLLGRPRGLPQHPVAVGWPDGYPLGRSVNVAGFPILSWVGTDLPTDTSPQTITLPDSGEGQILLVVFGASSSDAAPTTPSGWFAPGASGACFWYWKIADGTEGTSLPLTLAVNRRGAAIAAVIDKADKESFPYYSAAQTNVNAGITVSGIDQPDWRGRPALDIGCGRIASGSLPSPFPGYTMEGQTCSTASITAWIALQQTKVYDDLAQISNSQGALTPSWNTRRFLALSYRPNGKVRLGMEGADYVL